MSTLSGAEILEKVTQLVRRYVVLGPHELCAVALWVAHTHAIEAFDVTPYLGITAPEKRTGKTRLMETVHLLVARPWLTVLPSEAVLYRTIDAECPTLLLDETDAIFGKGRSSERYEPIRLLLNAGYRRGARVPRCIAVGKDIRKVDFDVFCPKALAGIGDLPDTVADRAIRIRLARRARNEKVDRFREREAKVAGDILRSELAGWVAEVREEARDLRPHIPDALWDTSDRLANSWEPLFALADLAGDDWPARARVSALALAETTDDDSLGVRLLTDIRDVFETQDATKLSTADLLKHLVDIENAGAPWGEWWGQKVDANELRGPGHKLAQKLLPFGIRSVDIRTEHGTRKGYQRADLEDAWARYVPSPLSPPQERDNATAQVNGQVHQFLTNEDEQIASGLTSDVALSRHERVYVGDATLAQPQLVAPDGRGSSPIEKEER